MRMQKQLKIAVCDDNAADRAQIILFLSQYLDEENLCAHIDEYTSGEGFLAGATAQYALVFLDIFMDGINGMETAKKLIQENSQVQIIFNSTSGEFAAESYEVAALYYLVKPLEKEKLWPVLDKFFQCWYAVRMLTVKTGRTEEDVYLSDILFAEAHGKKSILHTKRGDLEASASLSELQAILPPSEFVRPIRYALVSVREIVKIPSHMLILSNGAEIPVSRSQRDAMKKAFADYQWRKLRAGGGGV